MAELAEDERFAGSSAQNDDDDDVEEPVFTDGKRDSSSWRDRLFEPASWQSSNGVDGSPQSSSNHAGSRQAPSSNVNDNEDQHTELYGILNLEKDARTEDVLKSYRTLAVLFHPDKHNDPSLKAAAEESFARIQHAYEILKDPRQRAMYDTAGEEGLKANWEVGPKLKSSAELRAEFEEAQYKRAQIDIENLIRSRTEVGISFDASAGFDQSTSVLSQISSISSASVRQLTMRTSTASVLSPSTSIIYSGHMAALRGRGGGNFTAMLKHQYNTKLAFEVGGNLLHPRTVSAKAAYILAPETSIQVDCAARTLSAPPAINIKFNTQVRPNMTAAVGLNTGSSYSILHILKGSPSAPFAGSPSTITAGLATPRWSVDVATDQFLQGQASVNYGGMRVFGSRRNGWKLSLSSALDTSGNATFGITTDRRITDNTSFGVGVGYAPGRGSLTLRIRVNRLGQRLSVPILLSQAASPTAAICAVAVPGISIAALQHYYLEPVRRRRIARRLRDLRDELRDTTASRRSAALSAMEVMREQAERKRITEEEKGGLVILDAVYQGTGSYVTDEEAEQSLLNVTVVLQALVTSATSARGRNAFSRDSSLTIPGGRSKSHLIGFYDILPGSKKKLVVHYTFRGRRHEATFDDVQAVAIPMRSHIVQ